MNIIILGAGQVGSSVASELARESSNEITVIDVDQGILSELQDRLDLRTVYGNGSFPSVLRRAGADDADMLIALTNSCLLYTSPSPRDGLLSRMPSSA